MFVATDTIYSLASKYAEVKALKTLGSDYLVIDRAVFSDKPAKNIRQRYQILDAQERVIVMARSWRAIMLDWELLTQPPIAAHAAAA